MGPVKGLLLSAVLIASVGLFGVGCESAGGLAEIVEDTRASIAEPVSVDDVDTEIAEETHVDEVIKGAEVTRDVSRVLPEPVKTVVDWVATIGLVVGGVWLRQERRKRKRVEVERDDVDDAFGEVVTGVSQALKHVASEDEAQQLKEVMRTSQKQATQEKVKSVLTK